jgi:hypothetical protein
MSRHETGLETDAHITTVTKPENKNQNHSRPILGQGSALKPSRVFTQSQQACALMVLSQFLNTKSIMDLFNECIFAVPKG